MPASLRAIIGLREFTSTLRTGDRAIAVPLALQLAAIARRLFNDLHTCMSTDDMKKALADARAKLRADSVRQEMEEQIHEAHQARIEAVREASLDRAAERRELQAQVRTLEQALSEALKARHLAPGPATQRPIETGAETRTGERLNKLLEDYLDGYPKDRKPQMFKKLQPAMALLGHLHGQKPIRDLRQAHIVEYFKLVEALPLRWAEKCERLGVTPTQLAASEHATALSKKTFLDNYEVPVRLFLTWARLNWQDQGFPTTLTTEGTEFGGDHDEGKNKQRALTHKELERLFEDELSRFKGDPSASHRWWLPALAYYTGARVNELCQLNPMTDVLVSSDGIHHLLLSELTEGDLKVRKSIKTGVSRRVPLHPDLLAAGFLRYVEGVRKSGAKLLFPAWAPTNGRASTQAERWFRDLLRESGLRDETPGARVVGFHCFRHTLLALAANSDPVVDAGPITGHADYTKSATQRGYEGELHLSTKLKLLQSINFTFKP